MKSQKYVTNQLDKLANILQLTLDPDTPYLILAQADDQEIVVCTNMYEETLAGVLKATIEHAVATASVQQLPD